MVKTEGRVLRNFARHIRQEVGQMKIVGSAHLLAGPIGIFMPVRKVRALNFKSANTYAHK
jgi:hypothetical protein